MFTTTKIFNKPEKLKSSLTQIEPSDLEKINKIIEKIKQNPDSYNFLYPVDVTKITDYLRVIKDRPMDISTIETKLKQKRYHFIQDIVDDFQLIWDNCRIYNREDSLIYNQAEKMDKFVKKLSILIITFNKTKKKILYLNIIIMFMMKKLLIILIIIMKVAVLLNLIFKILKIKLFWPEQLKV